MLRRGRIVAPRPRAQVVVGVQLEPLRRTHRERAAGAYARSLRTRHPPVRRRRCHLEPLAFCPGRPTPGVVGPRQGGARSDRDRTSPHAAIHRRAGGYTKTANGVLPSRGSSCWAIAAVFCNPYRRRAARRVAILVHATVSGSDVSAVRALCSVVVGSVRNGYAYPIDPVRLSPQIPAHSADAYRSQADAQLGPLSTPAKLIRHLATFPTFCLDPVVQTIIKFVLAHETIE